MIGKLSLIAVAGAIGSLARYYVSGISHRVFGSGFPMGTLIVNVLGSLLFGMVFALAEERMAISPLARTAILVGFMGAFTTFSTFAFETMGFVRDSQYLYAFLNITSNCVLGFGAVLIGMWAVKALY
jgi:fluoride exporter